MLDALAYKFSLSDVVNGVIASFVFLLLAAAAGYVGRRMWEYAAISAKKRRRKNFIEISKRIRSDEYLAATRRASLVMCILMLVGVTTMLQLYDLKMRDDDPYWSFFMAPGSLLGLCATYLFMKEEIFNYMATKYRMRIEQRRKNPRARQGQRRANSLSVVDAPHSAGLRPEPSIG
jgi:hypothetical protein